MQILRDIQLREQEELMTAKEHEIQGLSRLMIELLQLKNEKINS